MNVTTRIGVKIFIDFPFRLSWQPAGLAVSRQFFA